MVTVTGQTHGSTATHTCNSGFELLDITPGNDVRTCQPDGTWSGDEAQCIGILMILSMSKTDLLVSLYSSLSRIAEPS